MMFAMRLLFLLFVSDLPWACLIIAVEAGVVVNLEGTETAGHTTKITKTCQAVVLGENTEHSKHSSFIYPFSHTTSFVYLLCKYLFFAGRMGCNDCFLAGLVLFSWRECLCVSIEC
jgi:hypothetical protein